MTSSTLPAALSGSAASVRHLPVNLFASVMGLSGLAIAWRVAQDVFGSSGAIADAVGVVAIAAFLAIAAGYLAKLLKYPDAVKAEFNHPVAGNFFGTITISLLLLSAIAGRYDAALGQVVWTIGTVLTLVLGAMIVSRLMQGKVDHANAVPAWLIPGVASLDIVVTGATMPMAWAHEVNLAAAAIGTMVAILFFVMIFARLTHQEALPPGLTPSLLILAAPFEVGFLAYVGITGSVDMFASMLFYFGLFMTVVVSVRVFRFKTPFGPSWWAIGFPLAALAIAALKYALIVPTGAVIAIASVALIILTVAIAVLFVRTLYWLVTGKLLAG